MCRIRRADRANCAHTSCWLIGPRWRHALTALMKDRPRLLAESVAELRGIINTGDGRQLWLGAAAGTGVAALAAVAVIAYFRHRRKHGARKGMYTFGGEAADTADEGL